MDAVTRLGLLEKRVRALTLGLAVSLTLLIVLITSAWTRDQEPTILRARGLIIVDSMGRERILMGSPIPEDRGRIEPSTGLAIRDTTGAERFGLGLFPSGQMGMGFDAPRGTGDDRNRERINIVADSRGGASIRFLNRQTGVAGYLLLGSDDNLYLQMEASSSAGRVWRQIGALRDTTIVRPK